LLDMTMLWTWDVSTPTWMMMMMIMRRRRRK
jgi:hypothetical protein